MVTKSSIILAKYTLLTFKILANAIKIAIITIKMLTVTSIPKPLAQPAIIILHKTVGFVYKNKILNDIILANDFPTESIIHTSAHNYNITKIKM